MQLLPDATIQEPPADAPAAGACAQAMLDGLPQVMWFIRRQMRRHRAHGLSVPQFRTLVLLDRCPAASVSLVAENLGASLPTASRLISGLVAKGLVVRQDCPGDRRQVSLGLTPRGRLALGSAQQATRDAIAREIAHLGDEQRATIVGAMRLLQDVFAGGASPDEGDDEAGGGDLGG